MNIETIVNAAIQTHLWCDVLNDDRDDCIDARAYPLDAESEKRIAEDVKDFIELAKDILAKLDLDDDEIGHNFALTRNGHGAGFWDMGFGEVGEKLTDLSDSFSNVYGWIENDIVYLES